MNRLIAATMLIATATSAMAQPALQDWQKKALKLAKSEPKILNAKWRDPGSNMLWVAVNPDGSNRDGFAQYLCLVLAEAGAPSGALKTVWIYDKAGYESGENAQGMAACK